MPVHIQRLTTDVGMFDGDLPLNDAQLDRLAELVAVKLEEMRREEQQRGEATGLRLEARPPLAVEP